MLYTNVAITPDESRPQHTRINVYSVLNDWMDYDFVVDSKQEEVALEILQTAFDEWNMDDDPALTMFEFLEDALTQSGIMFDSKINCPD